MMKREKADKIPIQEWPTPLTNRLFISGSLSFICIAMLIASFIFQWNYLTAAFILCSILLLIDSIRMYYYVSNGKWLRIIGTIVSNKRAIEIKARRNIRIRVNDNGKYYLYSFIGNKKAKDYDEGQIVEIYTPENAPFLEINGVKQINSILAMNLLASTPSENNE